MREEGRLPRSIFGERAEGFLALLVVEKRCVSQPALDNWAGSVGKLGETGSR